jgi:hypothetical protein
LRSSEIHRRIVRAPAPPRPRHCRAGSSAEQLPHHHPHPRVVLHLRGHRSDAGASTPITSFWKGGRPRCPTDAALLLPPFSMACVTALLPPPFPMVRVAASTPGCDDADAGAMTGTRLQDLATVMSMKGRQWGLGCSALLRPCRRRGGPSERPPPSAPHLCNARINPPPHG